MPNWVINKVTLTAPSKARLAAVCALLEGLPKNGASTVDLFSFNNVVPMPPELDVTAGPEAQYLEAWYGIKGTFPLSKARIFEIRLEKGSRQLADAYKSNLDRYGHATWYTWCIEYWGTKWPATCTDKSIADDGMSATYVFNTAWSVPLPVYKKLSEMFPDVSLYVEVDEESGAYWGSLTLQAGVLGQDLFEGYRPGGPFDRGDEDEEDC